MTAQAPYESLIERARKSFCALMKWRSEMPAVWYGNPAIDEAARVIDLMLAALPERAPVSAGGDAEPRFFVDHGMVHDRKTGKHLVGCNYAGETPEALIAVLRELENDRDAWRLTAKALDAATLAPPVGADWVMVPREATIDMFRAFSSWILDPGESLDETYLAANMPDFARGYRDMLAAAPQTENWK